jgi:hypothetical protein
MCLLHADSMIRNKPAGWECLLSLGVFCGLGVSLHRGICFSQVLDDPGTDLPGPKAIREQSHTINPPKVQLAVYIVVHAPARLGMCWGHAYSLGLMPTRRALVTGNEIPRIVAHRCIMEASIGKPREPLHSPGHRSNLRAAQRHHSPGHIWL